MSGSTPDIPPLSLRHPASETLLLAAGDLRSLLLLLLFSSLRFGAQRRHSLPFIARPVLNPAEMCWLRIARYSADRDATICDLKMRALSVRFYLQTSQLCHNAGCVRRAPIEMIALITLAERLGGMKAGSR